MKPGIHMDRELLYRKYRNQGEGLISLGVTSLEVLQFTNNENFCYRFLRNYESCKVETRYTNAQWADIRVYQNQGQGPITIGVKSLDRFYKFPLMKKNCHTILKNYKATNNEQGVDVLCIPQSGPRAHSYWS